MVGPPPPLRRTGAIYRKTGDGKYVRKAVRGVSTVPWYPIPIEEEEEEEPFGMDRADINDILENLPLGEEKDEALSDQAQTSSDEDSKSNPYRGSPAKKRALPMTTRRGDRARDGSREFQ
jgi:hypothetical protein